jgi:Fur family transcriptional regulator, ferric uptake regulator
MVAAETITRALHESGYRLTTPRRRIARLIAERRGRFTADELLAASRHHRYAIGRATVFRSLDVLSALGLVERVDLPSGDHAYLACEPAHHHHVVCSRCGQAVGVPEGELGELTATLREVGRLTRYQIDSHRLELYGTCPSCQAAAQPIPAATNQS